MFFLLHQIKFDFTTIDWRVVLAALAIIVTILIAFYSVWWRNRKKLSYEILSNVLLVSAEKEIWDKVEIRYEGQPVKNVRLIVIKLINDGYVPIKKDDFEKEVKFLFPDAKILTAEKVKFHPPNIGTQLAYRDDWLTVDPVLFNRKDYVEFKLLLTEYSKMDIDARIVGISKIGNVKNILTPFEFMVLVLLFGFPISIIFLSPSGSKVRDITTSLIVFIGFLATIGLRYLTARRDD